MTDVSDVYAGHAEFSNGGLIDVHGHFGRSAATGYRADADAMLAAMDRHGVATTLVMPQPDADRGASEQVHAEVLDAAARWPRRIEGIVNIDPRLREADYRQAAGALLADATFVAIKIHTHGFRVAPDDEVCDKVFRLAADHGVPVMIHTGLGGPHTLPHRALAPARRYPAVPTVLCHAGFGAFCGEAIEVAQDRPNVYLEPSWCPAFSVRKMVRCLGAHRVMFGSDHIENIPVELAKFDAVRLTPAERRQVFAATAAAVFRLAPKARPEVSS
ncbi:amidohydrolase family protein [Verrucosispora sp. WMMD573]|uniref:amidohydrolase family protein n=1 Tax=Verrucosispora sp. WMMD573 TaxID=3015149 RepID=UPI00248CBEB2|nr:amidohydrolase family protein [Verrucosispora sp. WMMD573]WBB54656.1 amidohydrolase family protein [Verrucosispora sp. WMMD573]